MSDADAGLDPLPREREIVQADTGRVPHRVGEGRAGRSLRGFRHAEEPGSRSLDDVNINSPARSRTA